MKTSVKLCMLLAGLVFSIANTLAAEISAEQEWRIKAEIKQLVDNYAISRDELDAVGYANVFTKNGTLIIGGESFTGRRVLQARVEAVNPNVVGMHMMSTSQITVVNGKNATGIHYATVYRGALGESHEAGATVEVAGFMAQGKYIDKYQLTDEGWKISERRFEWIYSLAD